MTFNPKVWPRVKAVLEEALTLGGAARAAYIVDTCGDDSTVRRQVETLLAFHDQAATFLESPADVSVAVHATLTT
jgi:hypothetical protein